MKLAIMQPYLFPYIGYFQLAAASDRFVFYDDVNFIKNGWINRNRIALGDDIRYLTVPLSGASPSLKINEVAVQPPGVWLRKTLEQVRHAYARAPYYAPVSELVARILSAPAHDIGELAARSVTAICDYVGIRTEFVPSSTIYANAQLKSVERVLDICRAEHATTYVNLPGGRALYSADTFAAAGIELAFIEPDLRSYPQSGTPFIPALSILDVLMFNGPSQVKDMLCAREAA